MKNLCLFLIFTLVHTSVFSQTETAGSLRVINETKCNQYFAVMGAEKFCDCNDLSYATSLITIEPGQVKDYENSTMLATNYEDIPYSTFDPEKPGGIVMARIVDRDPKSYCNDQDYGGGSVGQPCIKLPQPIIYKVKNNNCKTECGETQAEWIPAKECKGQAILIFSDFN